MPFVAVLVAPTPPLVADNVELLVLFQKLFCKVVAAPMAPRNPPKCVDPLTLPIS